MNLKCLARAGMIHNKMDLKIPAGRVIVEGTLICPLGAKGFVCLLMAATAAGLAQETTTSRALELNKETIGTLLFDLLTQEGTEGDVVNAAFANIHVFQRGS